MAEGEYEKLTLAFAESVATLTLNDPGAMNAVSMAMLLELRDAMGRIEDPANGARCLVLTGAGRGFCAGANLADPEWHGPKGIPSPGALLEDHYHPIFLRLRELKMPIIGAVNGAAAGIGMSFALMTDIVIAARSAYFLQAFRRIGLVPDGGSTWLLLRLIGRARALELSMLGERLSAEKAQSWGLIARVCDDADLMTEAYALAKELAAGPTAAFSLIRKAYWESADNSFESQLHLEAMLQRQAGKTKDFLEGVSAFLEKRPANFRGE